MSSQYDVIVIGGGAGGLTVASGASQLGLRVALIEKQAKLGGDCLHYGCVPSKSFIHAANVAWQSRHAGNVGLQNKAVQVDLKKVNAYVDSVISKIQQHDDPERFRSYGCDVIQGTPHFIDKHTLQCGQKQLTSKRFVLATGSSPNVPTIPGLLDTDYLTNETAFQQNSFANGFPKQFVVLGSGPVGLEIAQAMARFGAHVILIEKHPSILPWLDSTLREQLLAVLADNGVQVKTNLQVERVKQLHSQKQVICKNHAGETVEFIADAILVATGRQPNVADLQLDNANVTYSDRGITVDKRMRTSQKHIYAIGDVQDTRYRFTHMAEYHAGIVIANIAFRLPKSATYHAIPSVIFTQPELAHVGMTLTEANTAGITPKVVRWPYADIDRALAEHTPQGMIVLLLHKQRIIGATILGAHAGELIAELTLAVQNKLKISTIANTIHAYPTFAQGNRRAVNQYYAEKLFHPVVKRLVKWLNKW